MIITTKTKNIVLLALVSTFIMSIVSYTTQQQSFAQGLFQSQQSERNQSSVSPPPITTEEDEDNSQVAKPATNNDQKIILGNITIPITSNTQLSLEMPDSKITVEPNE
jgi:hypothetical protein